MLKGRELYSHSKHRVAANVPHTPEEPKEVNEML